MTTINPAQKDILEKLNEIALEANWGGIDRVYTAEAPNGMPKAVAVIQEAMEEIKRLREQNDELYNFKRQLEDELIENGFAEYADENFKTLTDYKNAVKEILTYVGNLYDDDDQRFQLKDYQWHKELCTKYGVTLDENNS